MNSRSTFTVLMVLMSVLFIYSGIIIAETKGEAIQRKAVESITMGYSSGINTGYSGSQMQPRRDDSGGPDDYGYRWIDSDEDGGPEYEWIDISEDGDELQFGDDANVRNDLEFEFEFYGEVYDEIYMCSNGWASFTSNATFYNNDNWDLPGGGQNQNVPAMLAVAFSDWYPPEGGSFYFFSDEDMTVCSWEDLPHISNGANWSFQIVLYPNGKIIYNYRDVNGGQNDIVCGVQNEDSDIGLEITNHEAYHEDEMAILILGEAGWLTGIVSDLATDEPIAEAIVTLSDGSSEETDDNGVFWFDEIITGEFTATIEAYGYNPYNSEEFEVANEETTEVAYSLTHPEIEIDAEDFSVTMDEGQEFEDVFTIMNAGNGPLSYWMSFSIPWEERDEPGDIYFDHDLSEECGDEKLYGFTLLDENYYATGGNNNDDPNYVYVFDIEGDYLRRFEQPVEEPSSRGMKTMTNDGEYLYSADGRDIVQFDVLGEVEAVIPGPMNPVTNLTYDAETDHFWVATARSEIVEIDREGEEYREVDFEGSVYGIDWHAEDLDGYFLYVFTYDVELGQQIYKIHPDSNTVLHVLDIETGVGDEATDCIITDTFNPLVWMMVGLVSNGAPDRIVGVELELNTSWVKVDPMFGDVAAESDSVISITFNSEGWDAGEYELLLSVFSNAAGDEIVLPISMKVNRIFEQPEHFAFNPTNILHEVIVTNFTIHGVSADLNDEVGVFTPDGVCAGAAQWMDETLVVPAYGDDPETADIVEGFTDAEELTFRYWDMDVDLEGEAQFMRSAGDSVFTQAGSTTGEISVPDPNWPNNFDYKITEVYHEYFISEMTINEVAAVMGDEFAVFVDDMCIGGYTWQGEGTGVRAYSDDPFTEAIDGFVDGDSAAFRIWDADAEMEYEAEFTRTSGDTALIEGGYTEGTLLYLFDSVHNRISQLPEEVYLSPAFPNPFNESTVIRFGLPGNDVVKISVYDLHGRNVTTLTDAPFTAGNYSVGWRADNLSSGTYIILMQTTNVRKTTKLLLLR